VIGPWPAEGSPIKTRRRFDQGEALPPDRVGERNLEIGQFGKPPKDGYLNPVLTPPLFFGHRLRASTQTADPRREGARGTSCSAMGHNLHLPSRAETTRALKEPPVLRMGYLGIGRN
jgi:hypothetical protein